MRPIRRALAVQRLLGATGLSAALVLTATACNTDADSSTSDRPAQGVGEPGGIRIPDELREKLKEHGLDWEKWRDGAWRDWSKKDWLREAEDYINPIIEDLWDPDRMRRAIEPDEPVSEANLLAGRAASDPAPVPVRARPLPAPYRASAPEAGKVFFDGPQGSMVCSGTVVADPARPGRSNLVWTAGHCVHAGKEGGWYRNIAFVPSYNDAGKLADGLRGASREQVAPHGVWWSDWASASPQWLTQGAPVGGGGAPYDYAVLHVTPEEGDGASLEEVVGSALPVEFDALPTAAIERITAIGYPAAEPFDGQRAFQCTDRPGRLSLNATDPVMYRIGCTMTGGSSGGGWVAQGRDGRPALVSNTSIGPEDASWLAGPRLDAAARSVFQAMSRRNPH
ncbi:trypsin-like serine peptidase [Streptomyces sp. NPDC006879]|uniref:trypsin-like serine peptidase n=1 Tax=Streptomyces sp. NPDC006879 TaxID=3364767 RepID=UPI003694D07A